MSEYIEEDPNFDQTKIKIFGLLTLQDLTNCEAAIRSAKRRVSVGFETRNAWNDTLRRIESVKLKVYRELSINKDYQGGW